ncbi:alpha/beta fold hydrolase [Brachybacterium sp. MASK1Z-5]|uniref:Alpha/beta fold hydrolase n=1 Tax=Brachybacterium halotolerans TaxID=2795215 RepID=A0ABS1BA46_9MICO|nr:alpha/beta fold hydrolase [Brachybacterium halotolerans]MBK0331528.1 alpha/beta fold hydrolase [Brachybacterium halotolerans]
MDQVNQKCVRFADSWVTVDVYGEDDGSALVLIPGVMADSAAWAEVARGLQGWETVAVVNRRGREPSGPLTGDYDLRREVQDAEAILRRFCDVQTLFGWSYGGTIALHLANTVPVPHVVAYEPIMAPFGAAALPDLRSARREDDLDRTVDVALRQVTGMPDDAVAALRADEHVWSELREVSGSLYAETLALNEAAVPERFAERASRIDLILGERNRGKPPYGTTFEDVAARVPRGTVRELAGQGHLAHLEAPRALARLVSELRVPASMR